MAEITAKDMRDHSRSQGLDPETWRYAKLNGSYGVYKGAFLVGELIFEDHAKILVDALNKSDAR